MANSEKSLKCSEKRVVMSYMPSRNPNDLKGQNIGKSNPICIIIPVWPPWSIWCTPGKDSDPIRDSIFMLLRNNGTY